MKNRLDLGRGALKGEFQSSRSPNLGRWESNRTGVEGEKEATKPEFKRTNGRIAHA